MNAPNLCCPRPGIMAHSRLETDAEFRTRVGCPNFLINTELDLWAAAYRGAQRRIIWVES